MVIAEPFVSECGIDPSSRLIYQGLVSEILVQVDIVGIQ